MWWPCVRSGVSTLPLYALLWCSLLKVSGEAATNVGPSYNSMIRHCRGNGDCDRGLGQTCIFLYKGCQEGQCMCDPAYDVPDSQGRCRRAKLGKDECTGKDKCPRDMVCIGGYCRCRLGRMTTDRLFCLQKGDRLLGHTCNPSSDRCFQKSLYRYSHQGVFCSSDGYCTCELGYKQEHTSCKPRNIGERGCISSYQCQGGALCMDSQCRCPNGYRPTAANTKCANLDALVNLDFMDTCNEMNMMQELRYCRAGLICQRCGESRVNKCVKFALGGQHSYLTGSSSSCINQLSLHRLSLAGLLLLLQLLRQRWQVR